MDVLDFKCLQCGKCCQNLIKNSQGTRKGISLLPRERGLFSEEIIKPQVGIGSKPTDKKFKIVAYQMIENSCPFLKNDKCAIHEKRPVACGAFPLYPNIIIEGGLARVINMKIAPHCTALEKRGITKEGEEAVFTRSSLKNEIHYFEELSRISYNILKSYRRAWIFDLSSDNWIRFRDTVKSRN